MTDLRRTFAQRLKAARHAARLTQQALAERAGVSFEMVSRIERAKGLPSVPTLVTLANVLGTSTDYLVGRDEDVGPRLPIELVLEARSLAERIEAYLPTPPSRRRRRRN